MKRGILGIVIIAAVLIATSVIAQRPERGRVLENRGETQLQRGRDMNPRVERMQFFTEEQQEAIKKIRLETAKELKPLRNILNEMEARQQTLSTADKADMNAINKNIEEIGKVKIDIAKIKAKEHQDIRNLLTEEQLLRFDNLRGNRFNGDVGRQGINHMNRQDMPFTRPGGRSK